ncbi:MAG TPA: DUF503 domain-containing protein [Candidatus Limnocylindria bacterium]|nr:DUF503 domain-containing protein [Candidatus Limnocylindria bacterium]
MIVLLVTARLRAPWCRSLKDKRSVVAGVMNALKKRFNVSVAESGLQDSHTLMEISAAALAFDAAQADAVAQSLYAAAQGATDAELYEWDAEYR